MSNPIAIQCQACGATGEVLRVTANLQCRCGSNDLDLWDGEKTAASQQEHHTWLTNGQWGADEDEGESDDGEVHLPDHLKDAYDSGYGHAQSGMSAHSDYSPGSDHHLAYLLGHAHGERDRSFARQGAAHGPGTGWGADRPDPLANWSDYAGPTPGYNPNIESQEDHDDNHVCPVCNGTGHDSRASGGGYDESTCRNCHGTGKVVYPTENDTPTLDAHAPNGPQLGGGSHGHFSSLSPVGTTSTTNITALNGGGGGSYYTFTGGDSSTMGSSAKVVVPGMKGNKVVTAGQSDKIMAMASTIVANNSGLSTQEAFELARRAVAAFPEDGDQ